jgi:hypothetical protein
MTSALPRVLFALCGVCLASAARADEHVSPIRDDAHLFHADAIARAEARIAELHRTFDRRLFVQTVASASPQQRRLFPFLWTPQVNRLLEEQARKLAKQSGVPGIYVVICTQPRDVHVIVEPGDDPHFTPRDADALRRSLARRLHDSGADASLLALVDQVQATLQVHAARGAISFVDDFVLLTLLGGGLGLWFLLCLIRYKLRGRQAVDAARSGEPNRTDDAALLGAMFGCPAGMWIYDKLYPCPASAAGPLCEPPAEPTLPPVDENVEAMDDQRHPLDEPAEDAPVSP